MLDTTTILLILSLSFSVLFQFLVARYPAIPKSRNETDAHKTKRKRRIFALILMVSGIIITQIIPVYISYIKTQELSDRTKAEKDGGLVYNPETKKLDSITNKLNAILKKTDSTNHKNSLIKDKAVLVSTVFPFFEDTVFKPHKTIYIKSSYEVYGNGAIKNLQSHGYLIGFYNDTFYAITKKGGKSGKSQTALIKGNQLGVQQSIEMAAPFSPDLTFLYHVRFSYNNGKQQRFDYYFQATRGLQMFSLPDDLVKKFNNYLKANDYY